MVLDYPDLFRRVALLRRALEHERSRDRSLRRGPGELAAFQLAVERARDFVDGSVSGAFFCVIVEMGIATLF